MAPSSPGAPVLPRIGLALLVSVLAGLVVAGLALPLVGGVGLAAKAQADGFTGLPAELATPQLNTRSRILAADGSTIATLFSENRLTARLDEVPQLARTALIAIEDSRFYAHRGVDWKGTARAAVRNGASGGVRQGGSTLTQQYVKNVLLEQASTKAGRAAAREQSLNRKLREARYAIALEQRMSKDQILEAYLNIAYYGNGVYGIKTAAAHYFGKPVQKLTLAEGALLAGMVQNPNGLDPSDKRTRKASLDRRNLVLSRMADLGLISPSQERKARREALHLKISDVKSGCVAPNVPGAFFCDFVFRQLSEDTPLGRVLGATVAERQRRLLGGGLTIRTTLDRKAQDSAQQAVDTRVPPKDDSHVAAVADVVEPGTGDIKAMAVNRTFGEAAGQTKVPLVTGGNLGFQGGSTFKVFVLAHALQMGIPLDTQILAPAKYTSQVFTDVKDGVTRPYTVSNAGESEAGSYDLVSGTADSVNTFYVQLEERTGTEPPAALAEALGVHSVPSGPLTRGGAFTLGPSGVSPLAMAGAYAAFAAHGSFCPPRAVTAITGQDGKDLPVPDQHCSQVVEPAVADTVTSVLTGVIDGPAPNRTGKAASIGRPAAGKTGTANESRSTWFIGYTPQLATAVWVGRTTPTPLMGISINGQFYKSVYGGSIAAPIWRDVMAGALQGEPVKAFRPADPSVAQGSQSGVPDVTGQSFEQAQQTLQSAGFGVRNGGYIDGAPVSYGLVARTRPRAGGNTPLGTTIVVLLSNGRQPAYVPPPPAPPTFQPFAPPTGQPTPQPSAPVAPSPSAAPATPSPTAAPARKAKPGPTKTRRRP